MGCPQEPFATNSEYLEAFRKRTYVERTPLSGGLNLTNRCNLKCVHCYIRDHKCERNAPSELTTDSILSILDEAAEAGCLSFLLTGGEPLLHPHFHKIYRHARRLGMLVTVFTNGTLLDSTHVELFRELPPRHVEITLYGATKETFDKVAGVPGAYDACHRGIRLLVDGKIPFRLKTMLMNLNQHEMADMQAFAADLGVQFRFDAQLSPTLDGDTTPLQYRIDPVDAVAEEMADREKVQERVDYIKTATDLSSSGRTNYLYKCGAGTTTFFISATGSLQPCIMASEHAISLHNRPFIEAWEELHRVRDIKTPANFPCDNCSYQAYCGYCPPVMKLEDGLAVKQGSFICRLGLARKEALDIFVAETEEATGNGKENEKTI